MDWSRTKTIMIITLIMTNLIIGYIYYSNKMSNASTDGTVVVSQIKDAMKSNKINFDDSSFEYRDRMPKVQASYIKFDLSDMIKKKIREDNENHVVSDNGYDWYLEQGYKVKAIKNHITDEELQNYISPMREYRTSIVSDDSSPKKTSEDFIADNISLNFDKEFLYIREIGDVFEVMFGQGFDKFFLDGAYIKLLVRDGEVIYYEQKWCEIGNSENQSIATVNYSKLLYKIMRSAIEIMEAKKLDTLNVTDLKLGFSFGSGAYGVELRYGELVPFLRFKSHGELFYVDVMSVE